MLIKTLWIMTGLYLAGSLMWLGYIAFRIKTGMHLRRWLSIHLWPAHRRTLPPATATPQQTQPAQPTTVVAESHAKAA